MDEVKIFENPEFGQVRMVVIDGEPWFVGKDVASVLGYEKERNAIQRHVDEDDALKRGVTDSLGRTQETTIINESGLYALIFGSKLPNAKKFKNWVTSEVLPSIRKTGAYGNRIPMTTEGQIKLLAQGNVELNEKIDNVKQELEEFKQDMPLLAVECEKVTRAVQKQGVSILGGKESNAYKDASLRQKVYHDIYRELKRQFGVDTYRAIKRSQCEIAVSVIEKYEAPLVLWEQIKDSNAQMAMAV